MIYRYVYGILRNNLSKTKYFWKYRHLLDSSVWEGYRESYKSSRRLFYFELLKKYNLTSVFEFGCASGPNFYSIKSKKPNIIFFGYDISSSAIQQVNYKKKEEVQFTDKLSSQRIKDFLYRNNIKKFDLVIFDRVLYMLNEKKLKLFLNEYSFFFKYIVIEDFHSEKEKWDSDKYIYAKNYIKIFSEYGFNLLQNEKSLMPSKSAEKFARRILFSNVKNETI
jgi:hypothetical protein